MNKYITMQGYSITVEKLRKFEAEGWSEAEIAAEFGISRTWLHKVRKKLGCLDSGRSDKGKIKVSDEEKRAKRAEYMRKRYREQNKPKEQMRRIGGVKVSSAEYMSVLSQDYGVYKL